MTAFNTAPDDRVPEPRRSDADDELSDHLDDDTPTVRIGDVDELQRAIPHLIGFHPDRSIVALGMRGDSRRLRVAVRIDAPLTPQAAYDNGARLGEILGRSRSDHAVITYYDAGTSFGADTVYAETELCFERTRGMQQEIAEGMDVAGVAARFAWPHQAVPSASFPPSPIELAAITQGRPTYRTRHDIHTLVQPVGGAVRQEVADLVAQIEPIGLASWELVRSVCEILEQRADARRGEEGIPRSTPSDLVTCALAASTVHARDVLLSLMAADRDLMSVDLWLETARCAPTRYVAGAATVAALSAYLEGDGVLARCAIDRALSVDPRHRLADLIDSALTGGIPPEDIRALLQDMTIPEPDQDSS